MTPFSNTVAVRSFVAFSDPIAVGGSMSGASGLSVPRIARSLERSYGGAPLHIWSPSQVAGSAVSDGVPIVVGPQRPEDVAAAEIQSFSKLRQGWDGEEAAEPLPASISQALSFIRVAGPLASALEATLHVDGSVLLELGDGADGSLKFNGDGTIAFAIEGHGRDSIAFDGSTLPPELHVALSSRL